MSKKVIKAKIIQEPVEEFVDNIITKELFESGFVKSIDSDIDISPYYENSENIIIPDIEQEQVIKVTDFEFYPNIENPKKVLLNIETDMLIQIWRDEITDQIENKNIITKDNMTNVKIIELKNNFNLTEKTKNKLIKKCDKNNFLDNLIITDIEIKELNDI